jgi:hypothetical protein
MTTANASSTNQPATLYRVSVLVTALLRMWRGWRIWIPVVVANAVAQGLLVLPGVLPYPTVAFLAVGAASILVLAMSFAAVASTMLQASTGPVSVGDALATTRARALPLLAWSTALVLVVTLALAFYVVPGLIVLALTPYLLLAVVDGQRRPLAVNFMVLRARWGRWVITLIVVAVVCLVMWLLSALNGFFVTGFGGAIIGWLGLGLVSCWLICAWALVYRTVVPSTRA